MDHIGSPISNAELQALIASIPTDLNIQTSNAASTANSSSIGDLSTASSSCIFPQMSPEINALSSMLSLSAGYPSLFGGFPMIAPINYMNGALPPHNTIESLGLINSAMYNTQQLDQQRDIQSAMSSPIPATQFFAPHNDTRPRAFSSAATLQHTKPRHDSEKRRKRCRKMPATQQGSTTTTIICTTNSATSTTSSMNTNNSLLRSLVEDDDEEIRTYPNKIRTIQVTPEEEELVRRKTEELLKSVPIRNVNNSSKPSGPLQRLIRDEDLPDEVGPDSPFRHYPKYQRKPPAESIMMQGIEAAVAALCIGAFQIEAMSEEEKAELREHNKNVQTLDDLISETIRQELIAAE